MSKIPESVDKAFICNVEGHEWDVVCNKCGVSNKEYGWHENSATEAVQAYKDQLVREIEEIDTSSGRGSGERTKRLILNLIRESKEWDEGIELTEKGKNETNKMSGM